jgi:hypothetical protein
MAPSVSAVLHRTGAVCRRLGFVFAGLSCFCLASACDTSCASGNQPLITYRDGVTSADQRTYESTPYDGEWLHYPANRRFEFPHHLNTANYDIQAFVAFGSHPDVADGSGRSNIAVAAGDILVIEGKTATSLVVRNDTCSEEFLYVRLVATSPSDAGASL